jgi:hypothetical protein
MDIALVIVGFVLILLTMVSMTTFAARYPVPTFICLMLSWLVFFVVILRRVGAF